MAISQKLIRDHPSGADKAQTVKYLSYGGKDLGSKFKMHRKKNIFTGRSLGSLHGQPSLLGEFRPPRNRVSKDRVEGV